MTTVLFVNERGDGFGHVNRLLAIAAGLRDHRQVFVVKDPALVTPAIRAALGADVTVLPFTAAPAGIAGTGEAVTHTLADILHGMGFADQPRLASEVAGWRGVLDTCRPDLVVSDFAPALRVATAGRVATVVVGNGFTVPPALNPLPGLRQGQRRPPIGSAAKERAILSSVNAIRRTHDLSAFDCVAELLGGDRTFAATYPFLDPYQELRHDELVQPFNVPSLPIGPAFDRRGGPHVFCYLDASYEGLNPLLTALNSQRAPAHVFVRNLAPAEVARHCAPHVGVHGTQADFRFLLPQTRLLVHHGGQGTIVAGLLAGVPQLLLPAQREQELNTDGVARLETSVGLRIVRHADPAVVRRVIDNLLENRVVQANALRVALDLRGARSVDPVRPVVDACRAALAQARFG